MKKLFAVLFFSSIFFVGQVRSTVSSDIPDSASAHSKSTKKNSEPKRSSILSTLSQKGYTSISPQDAYKRISDGEKIVLLDVRTPEEFAAKRIPGSILIPIEPVDMVTKNIETAIPEKDAVIFIYCRSGRRSVDAAKILARIGYTNVYDLGGINAWPFETTKTPL